MFKRIKTKIEHATTKAKYDADGNILWYQLSPNEGYKLHEITLDEEVCDEETLEPTGEIKLGFTESYVTAGADYDFEKNDRQIYVVAKEEN
jgi:hypothetical protein